MTLDHLYLDKLASRLHAWDGQIRRWSIQAEMTSSKARKLLTRQIEMLYQKRDAVQELLAELRAATSATWHIMKTGLETAWMDFKQAFERAAMVFDS